MAVRIAWDRYEVALLFCAYEKVAKGSDLTKEAETLSQVLRNLAVRRGVTIDETYRNVNGMKMQLANVQYLFTDGERGLSGASSMIREMYELYSNHPVEFQTIMMEAIRMAGSTTMPHENAILRLEIGPNHSPIINTGRQSVEEASAGSTIITPSVALNSREGRAERMADTQYGDEWKKFAHSIPALYAAIEKYSGILVGEFLQIQSCAETTYDQLQLSVRAINCLDREQLEYKSVADILSMPLARLAGMRSAGQKQSMKSWM